MLLNVIPGFSNSNEIIYNYKDQHGFCKKNIIKNKIKKFIKSWERGSTTRNASARILNAQHFFQKCHLLDRKSVNFTTSKSMPYVYHILISSS